MLARERRLLILAAAVTSAVLLDVAAVGHVELAAFMAPLMMLAAPLVAGRYLGEERIARLRERRRPRPLRARSMRLPADRRLPLRAFPRGGRLIADTLAVRPPPLAGLR